MPRKILIVGGGPAGAACAIEASRNGLTVDLFEKGGPGRDKICGGALFPDVLRNLSHFNLLSEVQKKAQVIEELIVKSHQGGFVRVPLHFLTLQRAIFDQLLRDEAQRNGCRVHYETEITEVSIAENGVFIQDRRGKTYEGDYLVLATGVNAGLLEKAGFSMEPYSGAALRTYLPNLKGLKEVYLFIDRSLGSGYAWIFPCPGDLLNVGLGVVFRSAHSQAQLPHLFRKFMEDRAQDLLEGQDLSCIPQGFPLRAGLRRGKSYGDRVLLIGEAAHCTYYLTGDGIGPALTSGILAGQTLASLRNGGSEGEMSLYQGRLIQEIGKYHRSYTRSWRFFNHPLGFFLFNQLIRRSPKFGPFLGEILEGRRPAHQLFSITGILRNFF